MIPDGWKTNEAGSKLLQLAACKVSNLQCSGGEPKKT